MSVSDVLVFILLGSNTNAPANITNCKQSLKKYFKIISESKIYSFKSKDGEDVFFQNQALNMKVTCSAFECKEIFKKIEKTLGRKKENKEKIPIDIDLVFYGNDKIKSENIEVPHPDVFVYDYMKIPISEIAKKEYAELFSNI